MIPEFWFGLGAMGSGMGLILWGMSLIVKAITPI